MIIYFFHKQHLYNNLKNFWNIAKYVIFLGIGLFLLSKAYPPQELGEMFERMANADFTWIILAAICAIISHLSRAARWNMLIKPMGYKPSLLHTFYALMFGYLANTLVPRMGEVSRCVLLNRSDKIPIPKLFGTVVVERIFDLLALLFFVLIMVVLQFDLIGDTLNKLFSERFSLTASSIWNITNLLILLAGFVSIVILFWLIRKFNVYDQVKFLLDSFSEGLKTIGKMKKGWLFVFHTLFIWVMYFFMSYLCFFAIDETSHLGLMAGLTTFVFASIGFIAPSPGGIGTYQWMFILALSLYGVSQSDAGVTAAVAYSSNTLLNLIVGLISFIIISIKYKKIKPNAALEKVTE